MVNKQRISQSMRMAKPAALALILAMVVLLFWFNFEYSLQKLEPQGNIQDTTGRLSQEQKSHLQDFSQALQEHFGLDFQLKVGKGVLDQAQAEPRTIFLALEPDKKAWSLSLPPLLKQALPQDFVHDLRQEHFQAYFAQEDWPRGLMEFAHKLWQQLQEMHKQEEYAE